MKFIILLLLSLNCFAGDLPDPKLTPGDIRTTDYTDITTTRTSTIRNVTASTRKKVFQSYGMTGNDRSVCQEGYEIDHLCSLELGCSNDIKNLWPQSYCGDWNAHVKDGLENRLASLIRKKIITPQEAQSCILTNWIECYKKYMGAK